MGRSLRVGACLLVLGAACASSPDEMDAAPGCVGGKCDDAGEPIEEEVSRCAELEGSVPDHLGCCWVEAGSDNTGDQFDVHEVWCQYEGSPREDLEVGQLVTNAFLADGQPQGELLREPGEPVRISRFFSDDGFPVRLTPDVFITPGTVTGLRDSKIALDEIVFEGPQPEAVPMVLPFEVWDVEIVNRNADRARLSLAEQVETRVEPVTLAGTTSVLGFGRRTPLALAVPRSRDKLSVNVELDTPAPEDPSTDVELDGPGSYELTTDGTLVRADVEGFDEPQGASTVQCSIERLVTPAPEDCEPSEEETCEPTILDELVCEALQAPGLAQRTVFVTRGEESVPMPLGPEPSRLDVTGMELPLEVEVHTEFAADLQGVQGLEDPVHVEALSFASVPHDPVTGHVPFDVWTLELQGDLDLLHGSFEIGPRDVELGYLWGDQFALRVPKTFGPDLFGDVQFTMRMAVSAGTQRLDATAMVVDGFAQIFDGIEVELRPGRWSVSSAGCYVHEDGGSTGRCMPEPQ